MEKKKELVSIILNCFNGEKYLKSALLSVVNQSYKNWELIFWDNRSTDKSKNILDSFKNKKIKYFYAKKHTSLYEARNLAINKSKGEYISFIDSDDIWEKNKLKNQIKFFKNKEVGVVYGNLWIFNQKLKKKKVLTNSKLLTGNIGNEIISNYNIGIITSVIRKKLLKSKNLKFDKKYNHIGDFDLFVKLSKICKFEAIQQPVATYRIHGENLSLKNSSREITELKNWIKKNEKKLTSNQKKQIQIRLFNREFMYIKLQNNFIKTFNYFTANKCLWKNFKNYFVLLIPTKILKRVMWYG